MITKIVLGIVLFFFVIAAFTVTEKNITFKNKSPNLSPNDSKNQEIAGDKSNILSTINENLIEDVINKYLPEKILQPTYNGKIFCSHHTYGWQENKETKIINAYVWAYCEEYYLKNKELKMGSGISLPVKITMELKNNILSIREHESPQDGEKYVESIKKIFPPEYAEEAITGYSVNQLSPSPLDKAQKYFQVQ